ncbi:MFS transporter [Paenibacillus oleatilyticus]|uniref:MFS transporter n=1 Tax=Paenibacillus oleatilyticus TaxID=2594886 RepID=UPI001C1F7E4D|nr:MFS transporter [Paenibacillus oleatilyticus]MBU7315404.1 MFS transporter [Paenibacillus oleatilyticus]
MKASFAETTQCSPLTRSLVFLMALTCGFTVANVYINQTLLVGMAHTFQTTEVQIGLVATLVQIGYAFGNLFLVPLGDRVERRRLIIALLGLVSLALALAAMAPSASWLIAAHLLIGATTVVPQIVFPWAAELVDVRQRGNVLGKVAIGLICGIFGARLLSGIVDAQLGWRAMYWISLACMLLLIGWVRWKFPRSKPSATLTYGALLRSLGPLFLKESVLRQACLSQGMVFGAFSVFWTTLAFLLKSPTYSLGSEFVGIVGLIGFGGVFASPVVGRIIDRKGAWFANLLCLLVVAASFLLLAISSNRLPILLLGAFLLTVGTQANQVACQARIFALSAAARSRLNGLYMVSTFLGGAAGSYLGVLAWSHGQWSMVCLTGALMAAASFGGLAGRRRNQADGARAAEEKSGTR